jgi:hypothetical protein
MAANQKPRGSVIRPVPDWFASSLSGGHAIQGAVAGQNSYVGIYNNASDGSVIRIYATDFGVSANSFVYFEVFQGQQGTLYNADGAYGSINPSVGTTWGQTINFASAVCLGSHVGGRQGFAGQDTFHAPGWPLGIIPPGYTFALQVRNTNITIEGAFWWLSAYN